MNEAASDRSGYSALFVCFCECERLKPAAAQVSELVAGLGRLQSQRRQGITSAEPDTREAAAQYQHGSQETTGATVQLVSANNLTTLVKWGVGGEGRGDSTTQGIGKVHTHRIFCSATMKMRIISQKHLQPSPPRAQENQDPQARWTNRYSPPYILR